jgi:hypothetical protein
VTVKNPQPCDIVRVLSAERNQLVVLFDTSHAKYRQGILVDTNWEDASDMHVVLKHPGAGGASLSSTLVLCWDLYRQMVRTQFATTRTASLPIRARGHHRPGPGTSDRLIRFRVWLVRGLV